MTRAEFLSKRDYWIAQIQMDLYHQLEAYMAANNIDSAQLAEQLGVTNDYISQVMNGDFDHKISKLVDLALFMGKVPELTYTDLGKLIERDKREHAQLRLLEETFRSEPATGIRTEMNMYKQKLDKTATIFNT